MGITIVPPQDFKTIPWKNGLGETTELAISEGGTLTDFDWRLSIATVAQDGIFSDFSGYDRNLVLISGQGISLTHDDKKLDKLEQALDMSSFDGGCKTYGELTAGVIKDFNIMTKSGDYQALVDRYLEHQSITLAANRQYFVYSLKSDAFLKANGINANSANALNKVMTLAAGHLLAVSLNNNDELLLTGSELIVIQLINIKPSK